MRSMKFLHRVLPVPLSESEGLWEERSCEEISDTRQQACPPCAAANPQWVKIYDPLGAVVLGDGRKGCQSGGGREKGRASSSRLAMPGVRHSHVQGDNNKKACERCTLHVSSHIPPLL